jgi:glycosyltransferase involved in cell wall biosynthesis
MHILLVSPYHGGSHQSWAEGYRRNSRHHVRLLTLPARFWKWRMHGGAVTLARRLLAEMPPSGAQIPDLILATDMLDVTTFLALVRNGLPAVPIVLYMHENQLTYPLPRNPNTGPMRRQRGERDLHYVFINYSSMLAADRILFNSNYHRRSLLKALPRYLNQFPEYQGLEVVEGLHEKSSVLPVGLDLATLQMRDSSSTSSRRQEPPLILWNQRWEYDKNPALFFSALYAMQEESIPFRLALCGERFSRAPHVFDEARERLSGHIVHEGYATRDVYRRLLWEADLTISTARHEFFGLSILEAIACQTFPILPFRLSYPELLPPAFHTLCLYEDEAGLLERLRWVLTHRDQATEQARKLAPFTARYSWQTVAQQYDAFFLKLLAS